MIWRLKNSGYSERTLKGYSKRLKMLAKHVNLDKPESVKSFIAGQESWSNAYKEGIVNAYTHYVRQYGLSWKKPVYKRSQRLPNVPTTEQLNRIVAQSLRDFVGVSDIESLGSYVKTQWKDYRNKLLGRS